MAVVAAGMVDMAEHQLAKQGSPVPPALSTMAEPLLAERSKRRDIRQHLRSFVRFVAVAVVVAAVVSHRRLCTKARTR